MPVQEVKNESHAVLKRIRMFAKVLAAMADSGAFEDSSCRPALGMLVRQASETLHWHDSAHYRSMHAAKRIAAAKRTGEFSTPSQYQAWCRKNLSHEHMVPVSVVLGMLSDLPKKSEAKIAHVLTRYSLRATITKEENRALKHARSMPECFREEGHRHFDCPLSRYRVSTFRGKVMVDLLVPRPASGSWFSG